MNVVVLMADTWQFNYMGCYGNSWIQTPNIDRLAAESAVFENAYAEGCPTVPTRRALMTGRYTLPYGGWAPLAPTDYTITDVLWKEPIRTALISDTSPMRLPRFGYSRGFDYVQFFRGQEFDRFFSRDPCRIDPDRFHKPAYFRQPGREKEELPASRYARQELQDYLPQRQHWRGEQDQMAAQVCRSAIDYLRKRDKFRPFFLWIDSFDPHEPWDPPSVWDPDLTCPYDPDYNGKQIINPVPTYAEAYLTETEEHHIRMLYAEKITMVDRWLGKVINTLQEEELYDDTLLVFLSDHGQPLGRGIHGHGIMRKCRPWPYEELVHIPLIIRLPGAAPRRVPGFVQTVDVAPTIMEYLGIKNPPGSMQGKSLLPMVRGEKESIRDFAVAGYYNFSWSIITESFSYIHWLEEKHFTENPLKAAAMVGLHEYQENTDVWTCTPGSESQVPEKNELYSRRQDPFQQDNRLHAHEAEAAELSRRLFAFMRELKEAE